MPYASNRASRPTVAYVDDDARRLHPQAQVFSRVTSRVDVYSHPLDAVEHIPLRPPTAVVIGQRMAHVPGVEVARALRARLGRDCPRLVLLIDDAEALTEADLELFDEGHDRPMSAETLSGILARAAGVSFAAAA